jgi:hypothetical protein
MKVKLSLVAFFWLGISTTVSSQCVSGNCYNGKGTYHYPSGARYVGQFVNGKIQGEGILYFSNGNKYVGEWVDQYREGKGRMEFANGDEYFGNFYQSRMAGKGTMEFANGDRYVGQWAEDLQHGKGAYFFNNGDVYRGNFERGLMQGEGTMAYADGDVYNGQWKNNKKNGKGEYLYSNGELITGFWENGEYVTDGLDELIAQDDPEAEKSEDLPNCNKVFCASGKGVFTYADGSRYVGEFRMGKPEGQGTCFYASGDKYVGKWKDHAPQGEGVMYFATGKVLGAIWEAGRAVELLEAKGEDIPSEMVKVDRDGRIKIWAVVVGVARYTHMPVLKYTDDDAYQIYAFLKSPEGGALPDEQIRVLIDEDATRLNILNAVRETFLKADENDVVMFYFSGHGLQGAFLPVDFDGFNNKLKHNDLKAVFQDSRAKHKICLADACHSGSMIAMRSTVSDMVEKYYAAFQRSAGGTALLLSSKSDEYSLEDMGLRQGVFSHFLIRGLKGEADQNNNKIVTISELYDFIHIKVRNYTANAQTPSITGEYDPHMPVAAVR